MAQIPLTEIQLMQIVHSSYEGNTQYPASTDDDYLVRRDLANAAVLKWDMYEGTLWNELWVSSSVGNGVLTIGTNTTTYALPTDFRFISSYVRLVDSSGNSSFYKRKEAKDVDLLDGQTANIFYITGNARTGYYLNFLPGLNNAFPTSADVGKTIKYEYYKRPSLFTSTTDIPECSNPNYFVHYILSYLYRQDDNFEAADREMIEADKILAQMQTVNLMTSWREQDSLQDGYYDDSEGSGFGT